MIPAGPSADAVADWPAAARWRTAVALALAAAVSLGLARFSYALMLPPMRADLQWRYVTAGLMNTANAAGYLAGALAMPVLLRRHDARRLMLGGGLLAALALALHATTRSEVWLLLLRAACGVASAASFVGGGLLAARLASLPATASRDGRAPGPGLVLGLYYGGTGLGIVAASLATPWAIGAVAARWPRGWLALASLALVATLATLVGTRRLHAPPARGTPRTSVAWTPMGWALAGYAMFGLGYIGYMTFIVTRLREQGLPTATVTAFYALLGVGVVASSFLWSRLLQRRRDGGALALLNVLLTVATLIPVVTASPAAAFVSGMLFGSVFLSVVASTTAFVRHNLDAAGWPSGIAAFTVVFAAGQIVGPGVVGWVADSSGGLGRGLALSAAALAFGALLASRQRPLRDLAPEVRRP